MSIGANLAAKHERCTGKVLKVLRVIGTSAPKVFAVGRRGRCFTFGVSLRDFDIGYVFRSLGVREVVWMVYVCPNFLRLGL